MKLTTEEYTEQNATDLFIGLFDGAWFWVAADKFQNPMNAAVGLCLLAINLGTCPWTS